uniref:Aryl sulfotransferase n=1 Tax=Candidatus Kentrum sp. LFY TaxID=2126342 RepID=A0A450WT80_9GAMM|nr:MAG: aryl sulfotransferase [Candidatus Kentron sp. LFY]
MTENSLPTVSRIYRNHHMDSTHWNAFSPRDGDVIVVSPAKSGTTWVQWIVLKLLLPHDSRALLDVAPWLDWRPDPLEDVLSLLEAQDHRRSIKTHLPLDGLRYFPQVRYVVVGRDGRDAALSLWNHYGNYSDEMYDSLNRYEESPFPRRPETFQEFWANWVSKGWFDWEQDGYPFGSHLHVIQSWWDFRHLPNILFVHFADLLADLEGEIGRVADHIGVSLSSAGRSEIARELKFDSMKKASDKYAPLLEGEFTGGQKAFFHKGKNGRWKDVLTEQEVARYEAAVARVLSPDCASWLERGRLAAESG